MGKVWARTTAVQQWKEGRKRKRERERDERVKDETERV